MVCDYSNEAVSKDYIFLLKVKSCNLHEVIFLHRSKICLHEKKFSIEERGPKPADIPLYLLYTFNKPFIIGLLCTEHFYLYHARDIYAGLLRYIYFFYHSFNIFSSTFIGNHLEFLKKSLNYSFFLLIFLLA